ncbi:substrate-binding domain-containing protein [Microbacterium sp. DT81.1]|uniref:substrate-binding domain-containing protein n=1 Tax=Microbacterium sp. DT81.1 TaxID=3393413 RepID=UPI003CED5548
MRKLALMATASAAAALLVLSGCSSRTEAGGGSTEAPEGFGEGTVIGVALPAKTSENWVIAGQLFEDGLKEAGFEGDVQYAGASSPVQDQQTQITSMITNGAEVIVIGAADGGQLGAQIKQAKEAGITTIAYDRLILNTPDIDYYIGFDANKVGNLQGQALLDGLAAAYPDKSTYNVELFSGSPDDANSAVFFDGAMEILQPKIDDGTLTVVSGQTDLKQTATQGWLAQNAQTRMDTLLQGNYTSTELDGVLSPNDTLARAILTSVTAAGKPLPVVTGQDSEAESVKLIMSGEQYSTIYKDTRKLVAQIIAAVASLSEGEAPEINDDSSYDNGAKVMESYLLDPVIVTKDNAADVYQDDPTLGPLTQ